MYYFVLLCSVFGESGMLPWIRCRCFCQQVLRRQFIVRVSTCRPTIGVGGVDGLLVLRTQVRRVTIPKDHWSEMYGMEIFFLPVLSVRDCRLGKFRYLNYSEANFVFFSSHRLLHRWRCNISKHKRPTILMKCSGLISSTMADPC